jgi:hypothetical protein
MSKIGHLPADVLDLAPTSEEPVLISARSTSLSIATVAFATRQLTKSSTALSTPVAVTSTVPIAMEPEIQPNGPSLVSDPTHLETESTSEHVEASDDHVRVPVPSADYQLAPYHLQSVAISRADLVAVAPAQGTAPSAASSESSESASPPTPQITSKLLIQASDVVVDRSQKLGEGGFGIVYVGTLRGSMTVAVKTIRGDIDAGTLATFMKEVKNWEGLVQRNGWSFCLAANFCFADCSTHGFSPSPHGDLPFASHDDHRSRRGRKPAAIPRCTQLGSASWPKTNA